MARSVRTHTALSPVVRLLTRPAGIGSMRVGIFFAHPWAPQPGTIGVGTVRPARENHMPKNTWSAKRERQYAHVKSGLVKEGRSEAKAEAIAARVVNKDRARAGEAKESSRLSIDDMSSARRGGAV